MEQNNLEEGRRTPRLWERKYRDSFQVLYVFNRDSYPRILMLRKDNVWAVWFIVKEKEYLDGTNLCFEDITEARAYAHKLMAEFNTGALDNSSVVNVDDERIDEINWSQLKRERDQRMGRVRFIW